MSILSLLGALLKLAASLAAYLKDRQLLDAGAKAQLAKDLTEMAKRGGVAEDVSHEIDKLSDTELDEELRK